VTLTMDLEQLHAIAVTRESLCLDFTGPEQAGFHNNGLKGP
jgi:hypothetical protein